MFRIILALTLILLGSGGLSGCSAGVSPTEPETFDLLGNQVQFQPPPKDWKPDFQEDPPDLGQPKGQVVGLVFKQPDGKGRITVTNLDVSDALVDEKTGDVPKPGATGKYQPLDQNKPLLNRLVEPVSRRDGKVLKQDYRTVGGENAYWFEFEFGEGGTRQKGKQVHFTKDKHLYSVTLTVSESVYASSLPVFDRIVETFKVLK
ncbi:MAG: hypothetical protein HY319_27835 [Armatimonadetes bacterium]|nr:hypothetical protein [Armatimonadota bacterium]